MIPFLVVIGLVFVIVVVIVIYTQVAEPNTLKQKKKDIIDNYNEAQRNAMNARTKHDYNMNYLNSIGFHTDRTSKVGLDMYFHFDYNTKRAAYENYLIVDPNPNDIHKKGYVAFFTSSRCANLTVFPYDKIVECSLLQDGSVVKNSEGSAMLAGTSVPMLGVLQGKASSISNEHQTGSLSVRLTLDDIQTPSVIFHFAGGVDKSSREYAAAFQEAQEVFGIFDAIVRMNLKTLTAAAPKSVPSAAPAEHAPRSETTSAPVQTGNESVFEKIRQLGKLRDDGLLTEEEFVQKKKLLMEQIR